MRKTFIDKAMRFTTLAGLACLISVQAPSQVGTSQIGTSRTPGTASSSPRAQQSPYTAEYKITHEQALADGTTITQETTETRALDSQGRRMTATTTTVADRPPTTQFMVFDPVARTQTFWQSPGKVAHVSQMTAEGAELHCLPIIRDDVVVTSGPEAKYTSESLGTDTIQGIEVRGSRRITTIPAGAMGNDKPLIITLDRWTVLAAGYESVVVREMRDDPRRGKTTRELTNLSESEPDAAIFQTPEGYEIVTKDAPGCRYGPPSEMTNRAKRTK